MVEDFVDLVAQFLDYSSWAAPTEAYCLAIEKFFQGNEDVITFAEVGKLSLVFKISHTLLLLFGVSIYHWIKFLHERYQTQDVERLLFLCIGERLRFRIRRAEKG